MKQLFTRFGFSFIGLLTLFLQSCVPNAPTITANNSPVCAGSTITITANTTTSGATYTWSGPGGFSANTATINIPNATAANAGTYSVYASNIYGSSSTTTTTVVVNPMVTPAVSIAAGGGSTACAGTSVTFTATPTNGGTTPAYQWKKSGANVGTNSSTYTDATLVQGDVISCVLTSNAPCTTPSNTATSNSITMTINPLPTINVALSGPATFCDGSSMTMTASGTGGNYVWQRGTTTVGTGSVYTATQSGSYTVTATLGTCNATSAATVITVVPMPSATITAGGPVVFCQGDNVVLSAPAGTGYTYQWKRNGGNVATTRTYTATQSGTYTVDVTSQGICTVTSAPMAVEARALPPAVITSSGPLSACEGEGVVLSANPGLGYTFQWKKSNINIAGATSISYTATTSGDYSVAVTENVCTNVSAQKTVTIHPLPVPVLTPAGPTTVCIGDNVVLNANTGSGYIYRWKRNGILIGTGSSSYTATQSGRYTVEITNANNCKAESAEVVVSVLPIPVSIISVLGDTAFCAGGEAVLNAPQGPGYVYQWRKDNSDIPGATLASLRTVSGGAYQVTVSAPDAMCQLLSPVANITVFPLPIAPIMMFNNIFSTYNIYTAYQWYLNGNPIPGANSYMHQPMQGGTYTVSVVDTNGCSNISPERIFTPNGVGSVSLDGITVYPNPASDKIGIDAPVPVNVKLLSADGKIVLEQNRTQVIDISQLADGIYLMRITDTENNLLKVERVMKRSR